MRRGSLSNREPPAVLIDFRCLVVEVEKVTWWTRFLRWAFRRPLPGRWALRSWALNWAGDRRGDFSLDLYIPADTPRRDQLLDVARPLWVRGVVGDREEGFEPATRLVNSAGYACFLTLDHTLLVSDRSVQLFTGPNHGFV